MADFEATPGEAGGSYLDDATIDELLGAAGVPRAPDGSDQPAAGSSLPERALARYWPIAVGAVVLLGAGLLVVLMVFRRRAARPDLPSNVGPDEVDWPR